MVDRKKKNLLLTLHGLDCSLYLSLTPLSSPSQPLTPVFSLSSSVSCRRITHQTLSGIDLLPLSQVGNPSAPSHPSQNFAANMSILLLSRLPLT